MKDLTFNLDNLDTASLSKEQKNIVHEVLKRQSSGEVKFKHSKDTGSDSTKKESPNGHRVEQNNTVEVKDLGEVASKKRKHSSTQNKKKKAKSAQQK
jgi:hypothetical protein